jgi:ABC-type tungstate transport system permease subunit
MDILEKKIWKELNVNLQGERWYEEYGEPIYYSTVIRNPN